MNLPPLHLVDQTHFYLQGEIHIDPSVAIAPGVLLQADSGCRIVIEAGACIGAGVVLHAQRGDLVIAAGVNLGAGVLVMGTGTIAANACVGSLCTVLNPAIPTAALIPPGTLLGDTSRTAIAAPAQTSSTGSVPSPESTSPPAAKVTAVPDPWATVAGAPPVVTPAATPLEAIPAPVDPIAASTSDPMAAPAQPAAIGVHVYGQGQVHQLLAALFPHRQPLNSDPNQEI